MKRLVKFTILILLAVALCSAAALSSCKKKQTYTQGLSYVLDESTGGYSVQGIGSATSSRLNIPPQYNGLPVTAIATEAFENCDFITDITIPDSVVSIGNLAFYGTGYYRKSGNWEREALYIGKHLIKVNESKTGSLVIRDGTTVIADCALYGCTSLTRVTIPKGVTSLGRYSFYKCDKIVNVVIPDSVKSIGSYAFQNCSALLGIEFPDGVTSFGDGVLWNCGALERCVLGEGIKEISYYAFNNCSALTKVIMSRSVTDIAVNAFYNCGKLASVTIPQSVENIGSNAFYGCRSLAEAVFENVSGWSASRTESFDTPIGIASDELADKTTAAKYLINDYRSYYWKKV